MDATYRAGHFAMSELEHGYGPRVHLASDPLVWTYLAQLCHPDWVQPEVTQLVRLLYGHLLHQVIAREFPVRTRAFDTRMISHTARGRWEGAVIDPDTRVVTVDIARAGIVPSQVCFEVMHRVLPAAHIRQDHIVMNRATDAQDRVTGAKIFGQKIGGGIDGRILLFPDPMGATGSSMIEVVRMYTEAGLGMPAAIVALHLIVTPEYLRRVTAEQPDLHVYALRLDRGLSAPDVLQSPLGSRWEEEVGLNDIQYIVPGAGGVGEIMNNAER